MFSLSYAFIANEPVVWLAEQHGAAMQHRWRAMSIAIVLTLHVIASDRAAPMEQLDTWRV